jgi:hypothetical protein
VGFTKPPSKCATWHTSGSILTYISQENLALEEANTPTNPECDRQMLAVDPMPQPVRDYISGDTKHLFSLHGALDAKMDLVAPIMKMTAQDLRNLVDFQSEIRLLESEDRSYDPKVEGKTEVPNAFHELRAVWPGG